MGNAMRRADVNVAPQINVVASRPPITAKEAAYRFSQNTSAYSAAELAQAAVCTKSAAKGWKPTGDNLRAPSLAATINMARALPAVRDWLLEEVEGPGAVEGIMRALYAIAMSHGPEAELAIDMLKKWQRPNPEIKNDAVIVYLSSRRAA